MSLAQVRGREGATASMPPIRAEPPRAEVPALDRRPGERSPEHPRPPPRSPPQDRRDTGISRRTRSAGLPGVGATPNFGRFGCKLSQLRRQDRRRGLGITTAYGDGLPFRSGTPPSRSTGQSKGRGVKRGTHFHDGQIAQEAEIQDSASEPLPGLRAATGLHRQVQIVPFAFPGVGAAG